MELIIIALIATFVLIFIAIKLSEIATLLRCIVDSNDRKGE